MFRNKQAKVTAIIAAILSICASTAAFVLNLAFGALTAVLCTAFCLLIYFSTRYRYKKIDELSREIDLIMHGSEDILFDNHAEGELAVLKSELQKMTLRLKEQKEQLVAEKVTLADSIADISHQIRTPLTSVNLLLSFLSEPELSDDRKLQLINELRALLARIDWLISALLKISKLDAGTVSFKQEQLPLRELVNRASEPLLIPIELHSQTLKIEADGSFRGDVSWTCEALCNILKNCMEHTPDGGTLTVEAKETALYSQLVISDNGSGVLPEDMPHIFERFYKGKNSSENSVGIGLALSRMIITSQNGTVKAENNAGKGTKFTIRFYNSSI